MLVTREKVLKACIYLATAPLPRTKRKQLRKHWRSRIEQNRCRDADGIVLSRAKSGRTWLRAMLSAVYQQRYGLPEDLLLEFDNFHHLDRRVPKISFAHGHALTDAFETPDEQPWPIAKPLLFLIRHPLDVAVSEYFQSTRRASAYKRELWGVDAEASMFDFVMKGTVGLPVIVDYLNTWSRRVAKMPKALILRYEDLRAEPEAGLARVVAHLDEAAPEAVIDKAVEQCAFESMKQRERDNFYRNSRLSARDPDDPDSYKVRRAKVGGYRDYFDDDEIAILEAYVEEHLDPALGYGGRNSGHTA